MSKIANALLVAAAVAAIGGFAGSAALADPAKPPPSTANCFSASDWQGWKSPSPSVIYIRVRMHDVYQLDLSGGSSDLDWPDMHLITKFVGTDWVCSPADLELYVADDHGFREPLIVKAITKLTPEEIAAIPPKFRP